MGLSRALATGVSGLVNHQKALDNIGDNLANVNTVGFKKGVFQFQTLLEQTLSSAMAADAGRGSINPITLGLGTQTGSINKVFTQGALETTGSPNDMAIYGNGFFVLSTGNGGYAYTRDGTFYLDTDGNLVGGSGYYVQGTLAVKNSDGSYSIPQDAKLQNISIPIGSTGGMSQTSSVAFTGNLDSRQSAAGGLQLFGSNAPSVNDIQQWMSTDFDSSDTTWTALEDASYVVSNELLEKYGLSLPTGAAGLVSTYSNGIVPTSTYYAFDGTSVRHVSDLGFADSPAGADDIVAAGYIPVVREIDSINGGNVQTSAALGVKVPEYLAAGSSVEFNGRSYTVGNDYTYPAWFYEANGGDFAAVVGLDNAAHLADVSAGWPNGFQGTAANPATAPTAVGDLPYAGETYPATLDTPLEHLMYYQGNKWTQPFASIKDGDAISVSFDKGESAIQATFTYNRPSSTATVAGQQNVDHEQSYTLEHFLAFLAGDVDRTGTTSAAITPAMFGAPVSADYPDGDANDPAFDRLAYQDALANVSLAAANVNLNTVGGVMGLVDVPPSISAENGGSDGYAAPMETAGAFTREALSQIAYTRNVNGQMETYYADSFNVSIVSNLGADNAISNISFSYNNVTHKTAFSAETEYSAAAGGSSSATVTYYDSLGNPKTATIRMALVSEENDFTTWRWYADSQDDSDFGWVVDGETGEIVANLNIGTGLIRFDSDGNYVPGADHSETNGIIINLLNQGVDDPIQVKIENGLDSSLAQDLDFSKLTYSASASSLTLESQNGYPPGSLESYTVAADGTVYGVYSTGVVNPIARLVLATIVNENGLVASGNNLFYTSPSSGDAQYGYATVGGRGEIRQYQLETSNVDLSEEFTKLIAMERGFQANSRVITTADEMLQELLNLKR
jgi:flagellar hook protein FlgE